MSWLKGLAGKAEDFLNQIDQNAAVALQPSTEGCENGEILTEVTWDGQGTDNLPRPPKYNESLNRTRPNGLDLSYPSRNSITPQNSRPSSTSSGMHSIRSSPNLLSFTPALSSKPKNDDDHLIEFLNMPPSSSLLVKNEAGLVPDQLPTGQSHIDINKPMSRPITPLIDEENVNSFTAEKSDEPSPGNYLENSVSLTDSPKKNIALSAHSAISGLTIEADELKTENRLLQNELRSFNNEMSLLLQRSKAAEKECNMLQQKLAQLEATNSHYNQVIKDKEDQAAHLQMELQLAKQELSTAQDYSKEFQQKLTKLKQESVNSNGAQSEALLTCRQQLAEKDEELELANSIHQQELLSLNNTIQCCKSEKASLSHQIIECQQSMEECKKAGNEWQEKFNKAHAEILEVRSELDQYRFRAQRILQDKEKLISELRGEGIGRGSPVDDVTALELEQLRQERELVREEAIQVSARLQATRTELAEAEGKFEKYKDQVVETHNRLQEGLQEERKRRQAAEEDCRTHSEGLHSVREELTRQRSLLASKLREREAELKKLRSQLSQRPISPLGDELESRLHSLTQTLVQKQTSLETITTERNAIRLQYEKLEIKHRETMALLYQNQGTINVNDTDDAKARVPSFLEESPFDTGVARRVKRVYSNLDAVSIRTGVFLRRYPLARILVLCYMVLLHVWVMIVLFTYTPEIHPTVSRSSKGPS